MNSLSANLQNIEGISDKYIYCPSGTCLNIPEIHYSSSPLKTEFQIKCQCQNNNNDNINIMKIEEFLVKSSQLNCFVCKKKLSDAQMIYCVDCKIIVDMSCVEYHHKNKKHSHYIQLNKNIFNFCLEHKSQYIFRCMDCNKSLCTKCNFSSHDDNGHKLEQIKKFSLNQNDIDRIKSNFEKQKKCFEKIKAINNNLMKTLENDIEIKERIINSATLNKLDYNSILNLNNIYIENNEKYEKLLDDILNIKEEKEEKNESEIKKDESNDYINNYLSILYYSLMINKEKTINDALINDLEKKVNSLIPPLINPNKNSENINNLFTKEDMNNYNLLNNNINNFSTSFISNQIYNSDINSINNFNQCPKMDYLSDANSFNKYKLMYPQLKTDEKNNNFIYAQNNPNQIFDSNENDYSKYNLSIKNNINNLNTPINKQKNNSSEYKKSNDKNNKLKNSTNSLSQTSSEKNIGNKSSKKLKTSSQNKNNKKQPKKTPKNEESNISSENQDIYSEEGSKKEGGNKKNNNYINNMIILKSGNVAVSIKEAIEIYNLRQLNFSGANCFYNNDLIQNNCLLQRINLVKQRKISYVFQLFDETLLCATYAKIFRIKLTNHDSQYEIMSDLQLRHYEIPTKIISLGNSFLVVLTEQKMNCNIKIYHKIDNIENDSNNLDENKINENNKEINKSKAMNENDLTINNNCNDVPAIGNCGLYVSKEIYEDTSFELIKKNINESKKLWVSIHPIERKDNNNIVNEDENYLYEFIATSNAIFDLGKNRVAFFDIKKDRKGDYIIEKIKEINGLSCSAEADSICQINEKYLCIGLQNHDLNGQISGFAFIDINTREISRIVTDQEVSCVCYNEKNNLLFASMEVRDPKRNYFSTKIYDIIQKKGDKGNEEIELKEIYQYRNKHTDIITSIQQMTVSYFKVNLEEQNILNNIIFATSSKDSTLEVVKAEI